MTGGAKHLRLRLRRDMPPADGLRGGGSDLTVRMVESRIFTGIGAKRPNRRTRVSPGLGPFFASQRGAPSDNGRFTDTRRRIRVRQLPSVSFYRAFARIPRCKAARSCQSALAHAGSTQARRIRPSRTLQRRRRTPSFACILWQWCPGQCEEVSDHRGGTRSAAARAGSDGTSSDPFG